MDPRTERMIRNDIRLRRSPLVVLLFIFLGSMALPLLLHGAGFLDRFLQTFLR
jgi:hypothetical protein